MGERLNNDWASRIGKVPWLDPAMRWLSAWQPNLSAVGVNSNVIGGVIAALVPLQMAALFQAQTRRSIWIGTVPVTLSGVGLLMSASRGLRRMDYRFEADGPRVLFNAGLRLR